MAEDKYSVTQYSVNSILGYIKSGDIAIPEIQRPFVWKNSQVRDLLDSLYKGYPTGYIILWQNHGVKLKDGTVSKGQKILIDGQQRITALMTSIVGWEIVNSEYKKTRVKIAFDPFASLIEDDEMEMFAVQDQSHIRSKRWIEDVSVFFDLKFNAWEFVNKYVADNPEMDASTLNDIINKVKNIGNRKIGVIELDADLNIDIVTDIFIRINSKGTSLSQGDFVMSKVAADEIHGGNQVRKAVDYFSHLSKDASFFNQIKDGDIEFTNGEYFKYVEWLKEDKETVFDPDCDDIIRIAFMHKFGRSKLKDLVNLLSGRNFETKEYEAKVIDDTYVLLKEGIKNVMNEHNFKQFMITMRSAGFVSKKLINSSMALDFAYTLYLLLHDSKEVSVSEIKRIVQKWYVLSVLTARYTSSPETKFAEDLKQIREKGIVNTLKDIEAATLSDTFWNVRVVQDLDRSTANNPTFLVYLAAQVAGNDCSLLSNNVRVNDLIEIGGDIHHIFPKEYLKQNGFEKNKYNHNANYVYLDTPVNISIGKKAPKEYFSMAFEQCETGVIKIGSIIDLEQLKNNLIVNCIPEEIMNMDYSNYLEFIEKRKELMAQKIKHYYNNL